MRGVRVWVGEGCQGVFRGTWGATDSCIRLLVVQTRVETLASVLRRIVFAFQQPERPVIHHLRWRSWAQG